MPVVNGKKTEGKLFESGNKLYLIELGSYNGDAHLDMRELYEKEGQLGRTQKAVRVKEENIPEFLDAITQVIGIELVPA
jgi:hypothetical protein